jgi:hypothetical protein
MHLLPVTLSVFTKRPLEWTGTLQRILREFVQAAEVDMDDNALDTLYKLPDKLVDLVQSGVLTGIEVKAGSDGIYIEMTLEPNSRDLINLAKLPLCDFDDQRLTVCLLITDMLLAQLLGIDIITQKLSAKLQITVRLIEQDPPLHNLSAVFRRTQDVETVFE